MDRKARMILVSGCSGSGKTTLSKQYASVHNLRYLCPDDFYATINGDERIHQNKFDVWMCLYRAIHIAEQEQVDCIIDTNALTRVDRDQLLGWFPNFEHHLIYVEASEDLRKKNNMLRLRHVPDEDMKRMSEIVEPPEWESMDKRWRSFLYINNVDNHFIIVTQEGESIYG